MKCPECDVEFPGARGDKCPRCGWQDLSVEPERKGLPWEERKELGLFTGFFQTVFIVLFSPRKAFELLRAGEIRRDPSKFFFISAALAVLVEGSLLCSYSYFRFYLIAGQTGPVPLGLWLPAGMAVSVAIMLMVPILFIRFGFPIATHIGMLPVVPPSARRRFRTTDAIFCYAFGATFPILALPVVGIPLAAITTIPLVIIGCRVVYGISNRQAVLAIIFLAILAAVPFAILGFPLIGILLF